MAAAAEARWFWYGIGGFVALCAFAAVALTLFGAVIEIRSSWRGPKRAIIGTGKLLGFLTLAQFGALVAGLVSALIGWLLYRLSR